MTSDPSSTPWIPKLTRREFRERRARGELSLCLIPVAATEQHLEHLAMEHDFRSCCLVAERIADARRPSIGIAPLMNVGISEHHRKHPGTLSASPGAWISVVWDGVRSALEAGFEHVVVLNGHGGNIAPMEGVWSQFLQRYEASLHFFSYWDFLGEEAVSLLKTGRMPGHAQEFETAIALAAFPENVRLDAMADQEDQEPTAATAEVGDQLLDMIVKRGVQVMDEILGGAREAVIPPFH